MNLNDEQISILTAENKKLKRTNIILSIFAFLVLAVQLYDLLSGAFR
jgi:hypothetical protein